MDNTPKKAPVKKIPMRIGEANVEIAGKNVPMAKQDVVSSLRLARDVIKRRAELKRAEDQAKKASELGVMAPTVTALREMLQQIEEAGMGNATVRVHRQQYGLRGRPDEGRVARENAFQIRAVHLKDSAEVESDSEGNLTEDLPEVILTNSFPLHLRPDLIPMKKKGRIDDDELEEEEVDDEDDEE